MYGKWGQRILHQLGPQNYQRLMRATNVVVRSCGMDGSSLYLPAPVTVLESYRVFFYSLAPSSIDQEVDRYAGAMHNGYQNISHFYSDMCAMPPCNVKHNQIAIPHLVLQSFDDPISTWRSNAANDILDQLYPWNLVNTREPNVVLLLTDKGGHVGWPVGWWPTSWTYMNDLVAAGFVNSFVNTRSSLSDDTINETAPQRPFLSSNQTRTGFPERFPVTAQKLLRLPKLGVEVAEESKA